MGGVRGGGASRGQLQPVGWHPCCGPRAREPAGPVTLALLAATLPSQRRPCPGHAHNCLVGKQQARDGSLPQRPGFSAQTQTQPPDTHSTAIPYLLMGCGAEGSQGTKWVWGQLGPELMSRHTDSTSHSPWEGRSTLPQWGDLNWTPVHKACHRPAVRPQGPAPPRGQAVLTLAHAPGWRPQPAWQCPTGDTAGPWQERAGAALELDSLPAPGPGVPAAPPTILLC